MCLWFFVMVEFVTPNMGLTRRSSKEKLAKMAKDHNVKEPQVHILYHIVFNVLSYMAMIHLVVNTFGQMYSPVHCHEHMVQSKGEDAQSLNTTSSDESKSKILRPTFLEVDCHYETVDVMSLGFHEV